MKFKEYLHSLNIKQLRIINQYWGCCARDGSGFSARYYRRKIYEYFIVKNRFKEDLENIKKIEKQETIKKKDNQETKKKRRLISNEMVEYMKLAVLDLHDNNKRIEIKLEKIGLIYNSIIPDEIKDIFLDHIRDELLQEVDLQHYKLKVKPSLFLKLLLLINRITKMPNNGYKAFELIDFEYDNDIINNNKILNYLLTRELASKKGKDSLTIIEENYKNWLSKKAESIEDFHNYIFKITKTNRCWNILKAIKTIMRNSNDILNIDKLTIIRKDFKREFITAIKFGLLSEIHLNAKIRDKERYSDKEMDSKTKKDTDEKFSKETEKHTEKGKNIDNTKIYMLSPELWYMLSGQKPAQWKASVIYANPDYQLFVPYNFNPFEVQVIDFYNGKEDLKYNDDYFIIPSIEDYHKFNNNIFQPKDLLQIIKNNCDNIPDLYKYELFEDIWD
ncbi:MAG: hypothetical protein ACOCRK_03520 [bacterium]